MRPLPGSGHKVALKHAREIPAAPSKIKPELKIPESVIYPCPVKAENNEPKD
jgi:hypothetical protein